MEVSYILKPTESALDLFEKIQSQNKSVLESDGGSIVQFFNSPSFTYLKGAHSSGRTEFVYQLILSNILPPLWGPIKVGGLGHGAIYFDLDLKLSTKRILDLTRHKFQEKYEEYVCQHGQPDNIEDIGEVVKRCYDRLYIFRCSDQLQLTTTLRMIVSTFAYDHVKLIALDSLDCFYYPENQSHYFRKRISLSEIAIGYLKKLQTFKSMTVVASVSLLYKSSLNIQTLNFQKGLLIQCFGEETTSYTTNISSTKGFIFTKKVV